jgi:hypothetical protein
MGQDLNWLWIEAQKIKYAYEDEVKPNLFLVS